MTVLLGMGRDASHQVLTRADAENNADLKELARRLAATPPAVDTNLYALRRVSVETHVAAAEHDAPLAIESQITVNGGAVAIFDPLCILDDLVRRGRPRRDLERLEAGDLSVFGMETGQVHDVRFLAAPPPKPQPTRALRLKIVSGVAFVSVPEASDGPRLGTVRLDPFKTSLDAHLANGGWIRVKPGTYRLHAYRDGEQGLRIHLASDPNSSEKLLTALADVAVLPGPVDVTSEDE